MPHVKQLGLYSSFLFENYYWQILEYFILDTEIMKLVITTVYIFLQVFHSCYENSVSACYFEFSGVPRQKVESIKPLLMSTLERIALGVDYIDMQVMKDILSNLILREESRLETAPHSTIADHIIGDVLYGTSCEHVSVISSLRWPIVLVWYLMISL